MLVLRGGSFNFAGVVGVCCRPVLCQGIWRWWVPTPSVLESRLRREPTGVRSLTCQHMAEIQAQGVPLMIDGSPSLGPAQLLWQDARLVLNTRCACVATSRFLRSWFVTGVAVRAFPPLARLRMR